MYLIDRQQRYFEYPAINRFDPSSAGKDLGVKCLQI
jgi:hypothetical protein